jgi:hypothetical protein
MMRVSEGSGVMSSFFEGGGGVVGSSASAFPHSFVEKYFVLLMGTLCRVSGQQFHGCLEESVFALSCHLSS